MKIAIIGAGHGGLQAAKVLCENGIDVTVYEKNNKESLSYDWFDDVENTVFSELDIPLPSGSSKTEHVSFVLPFLKKPFKITASEKTRERHIDRRKFALLLAERAEKAGAKIKYNENVLSLLFGENNEIIGIKTESEDVLCDLVIDSSGVASPFRASLDSSCGITKHIDKNLCFHVYRAFLSANKQERIPTDFPKKLYLKHLNEKGISWCIYEPDGLVNVLIGRMGEMSDEVFTRAYNNLKKINPIMGDTVIRGGEFCLIPIRRPLTKMSTTGYVAIGDAAFMTMPLIGSGIANSLRAGEILGRKIAQNGSVMPDVLWEYQVQYYKTVGADHFLINSIKNTLLNLDIEHPFKIKTIVGLLKAVKTGLKAKKWALSIPEKYDEEKIHQWIKKEIDVNE